jgi:hypothetical protein
MKHCWTFNPNNNTFATWGHTSYGNCDNPQYNDENGTLPLWFYRYDTSRTAAVDDTRPVESKPEMAVAASPNPFNSMVNIKINYELGIRNYEWRKIELKIFNISGKMIADLTTLIPNSSFLIRNSLSWNSFGHPSGLYFIRCTIGKKVIEKRISLVK